MVVNGVRSPQGVDEYTVLPAPSITPGTLRTRDTAGREEVLGNATQGELLLFNGTNFGSSQRWLRVFYVSVAGIAVRSSS